MRQLLILLFLIGQFVFWGSTPISYAQSAAYASSLLVKEILNIDNPTSQISKDKSAAAANKIPLENSLLWKVSGNGLKQPSYIFGTIHRICEKDFFWLPHMKASFDKAELLVMEVDYKELEELYGLQGASLLEGEETESIALIDTLVLTKPVEVMEVYEKKSEDEIEIRDTYGSSRTRPVKVPKGAIQPLPMQTKIAEKVVIGTKMEVEKSDIPFERCDYISYESKLTKMAGMQEKTIIGLESIDEQMELMENLYTNMLDANAEEKENLYYHLTVDEQVALLSSLYQKQDINSMLDFMYASDLSVKSINMMLYVRNEKWMEKLPAIFQQQSSFIAVGAGHLAGKKGLINLLRQKGYKVEPITK